MEDGDYYTYENELTIQMFDLNEIISFQRDHKVQILIGEDYQYMCYIDDKVYAIQLTMMFTLVLGIRNFNQSRQSIGVLK